MAKNRRLESYSQEERAEITQLLETTSMSEISRARGIPYDMIRRIRDYDPAKEAERHEKQRLASIERNTDPGTYVECAMCGYRAPDIKRHINTVHSLSTKQFTEQTGQSVFTSETRKRSDSERMKGDKNPAAAHGGRLSPWSKNFKNGYDEVAHAENRRRTSERLKETPSVFQRAFYASDADYKKAQTRNLDWFVEKYGEEEGRIRHRAKTETWLQTMASKPEAERLRINSLKFNVHGPVSKGETQLTNALKEIIPEIETQFHLINSKDRWYVYDIRFKNRLIEFDGDFWHMNPEQFDANYVHPVSKLKASDKWAIDSRKTSRAIEAGFELHRVWESHYNKDKEQVIQECINFLTR